MDRELKELLAVIFVSMIIFFVLGWIGNNIYREITNKKTIDGLWIPRVSNITQAEELANEWDNVSNWICINILDMSIEDIIETCEHEAGHEMFARYCAEDIENCINFTKERK